MKRKSAISLVVNEFSAAKMIAGEWIAVFNQDLDGESPFVVEMKNKPDGEILLQGYFLDGQALSQEDEAELLDIAADYQFPEFEEE